MKFNKVKCKGSALLCSGDTFPAVLLPALGPKKDMKLLEGVQRRLWRCSEDWNTSAMGISPMAEGWEC